MSSKIKILGLVFLFVTSAALVSQSMGSRKGSGWAQLEVLPEGTKIDYPIVLSDRQWRERLGGFEYYVLREKGTERAFTGRLDKEYEEGTYYSAAAGHNAGVTTHTLETHPVQLQSQVRLRNRLAELLPTDQSPSGDPDRGQYTFHAAGGSSG